MLLVISYDEETYISEKKRIEESTDFLEEVVFTTDDVVSYFLPEPEFSINSYHFRVVKSDLGYYPKYFGMIATSDEKNTIAYLYFKDGDLDVISINRKEGEMKKFVEEYFKYDW